MSQGRLGLDVLCLSIAAVLLVISPVVGVVRLTESAMPEIPSTEPGLAATLTAVVWIAALLVLTLATLRNARVIYQTRAGGKNSVLTMLLALVLVFLILRLFRRDGGILEIKPTGVVFNPPDWLPRFGGPGLPESPAGGPTHLGGSALILILAAGLAVLIASLSLLISPGISIFPGLGKWALKETEAPQKSDVPPVRPLRRWEGIRLEVIESYRIAVNALASRGVPIKPHWTHTEHLSIVKRSGMPEAKPLSRLTQLFEVARYSKRPLSGDAAEEARRLSEEVRRRVEE